MLLQDLVSWVQGLAPRTQMLIAARVEGSIELLIIWPWPTREQIAIQLALLELLFTGPLALLALFWKHCRGPLPNRPITWYERWFCPFAFPMMPPGYGEVLYADERGGATYFRAGVTLSVSGDGCPPAGSRVAQSLAAGPFSYEFYRSSRFPGCPQNFRVSGGSECMAQLCMENTDQGAWDFLLERRSHWLRASGLPW